MRSIPVTKTLNIGVRLRRSLAVMNYVLCNVVLRFTSLQDYKCTFCPSDFIDNCALKKHTLKIHGQETKGGISKDLDLKII